MAGFTKIIAKGSGEFPLDMLRFHQAWPASQSDVVVMTASGERTVGMHTFHEHVSEFALRRWESFGWTAFATTALAGPEDA